MKNLKIVTLALCSWMLFSCQTKQGTGTLLGGGGGAVIGGIIGNIIGKDTKSTAIGAAIGGAVGAGAGAIIGKKMDKVAAEAARVENAQVEEITDANGLKAVKVTFDSGILFATNKADLNSSSRASLVKFAKVLKSEPKIAIDVRGYTDSTGGDNINLPLSQRRAESVQYFLVNQGVSSSQFQNVAGYGSANPVAGNDTAAGRQQNRRVEVYMYASQQMIDAANAGTL